MTCRSRCARRAAPSRSRTLGTMSSRRPARLRPASVLSHLGVIVAVAAVWASWWPAWRSRSPPSTGRRRATVADGMDKIPTELTAEPLAQRTRCSPRRQRAGHLLRPEPRERPADRVAPVMRKAIIAIEDYRFYQHGALDLQGHAARVRHQPGRAAATIQGGSSITQQMVKLTLVNQAKTKAAQAAADGGHLPAQGQRAALRDRLRGQVLQGLDPRALPQHRLLR